MVLPGDIRGTQIIATKPYFMFALLTEFRLGRSLAIFGDFTVLTSPFTQINLPFFSHHPLLLNLGIKYTRGKSMFGFSFMEDLNLSNAPDIAIQLTYARRF
jgi:hypothetical protein